jgi:diaminopimelate epimerase
MFIDFEKWHGTKNDFIVTWILMTDRDLLVPTLQRLAPKICMRDGSGVGADGILILITKNRKDPLPDELVIINSDGSLAKNCGNGLRCAASSARQRAHRESILDFDGVSFNVAGNSIDCRFIGEKANPFVAVTMPQPSLGDDNDWNHDVIEQAKQIQRSHPELKGDLMTVGIGNPHIVFTVGNSTEDSARLAGIPMQSSRHGDGINVHIAMSHDIQAGDLQKARRDIGEPIGELLKVFPWERGVGATQACGTGACAVGVVALESGLIERSDWIGIDMPGGRLYVKQANAGDEVILAGPTAFVFSGSLEI